MSDEKPVLSAPRALSLQNFSFNFHVSIGARIAARAGAPAFASRRTRWDKAIDRFWSELEDRYRARWIAAEEGRIDDDGREVRQALLDADGRDPHALRLQKQEIFRLRADADAVHQQAFDRAWRRVVDRLELGELEAQARDYAKYFPIEANLATDPDTGRFLWLGKRWEPVRAPTRQDVLTRYPLPEAGERLP